jgi:hypothetical protein
MNRAGVLSIVLVAAVTGACGGSESASPAPTAPSSTPPTTTSPPPTPSQQACVPTNLHVASKQGTVVTLEWNAVSGATEYVVLVGSTPGSSDQLSTNTTNTNYTWTAKEGRQYARVQSKCNGQFGGSSNEVEYTVGN